MSAMSVVVTRLRLSHGVRADGPGFRADLAFGGPLAESLGHEREGRDHEEDAGGAAEIIGETFRNLQRGESLAGACHDKGAAVRGFKSP